MLSPVCTLFLVSALVLGAHGVYNCEIQVKFVGEMPCQDGQNNTFSCSFPTTNTVNCLATFCTLHADSQYSFSVLEKSSVQPICASEGVGIQSEGVARCHGTVPGNDIDALKWTLHVNVSLPDSWCLYTKKCYSAEIEMSGPPRNITAEIKGGDLLVQWSHPEMKTIKDLDGCISYQLEINNQITDIREGVLVYSKRNADPKLARQVRMRTKSSKCRENSDWGDWSSLIVVKVVGLSATEVPQPQQLDLWVIVCITLGIPMILLAFWLLVKSQRVYKRLFPPIPHPSMKVKHLLERDDLFQFTTWTSKPVEEITVVEEVGDTLATPIT